MTGASSASPQPTAESLVIGGLTPLTTIDFPGELAAVIYLQGCPWRCGYCQNADLQPRQAGHPLPWNELEQWLQSRRGLLDAVVFSGGEPTLQRGLADALLRVRSLGFKTGLHTAGIYPRRLREVLPLLDWVGLDIKAAYDDYDTITGVAGSARRAFASARMILASDVDYEFRLTLHPDQLDVAALQRWAQELHKLGAKKVAVQHCVVDRCDDEQLRQCRGLPLSGWKIDQIGSVFDEFSVRAA